MSEAEEEEEEEEDKQQAETKEEPKKKKMSKKKKAAIIFGCLVGGFIVLAGANLIIDKITNDRQLKKYQQVEKLEGQYNVIGSDAIFKGKKDSSVSGTVTINYTRKSVSFYLTYLDHDRNTSFNRVIENLVGFDGTYFGIRSNGYITSSNLVRAISYTENYEYLLLSYDTSYSFGDEIRLNSLLLKKSNLTYDESFKIENITPGTVYRDVMPGKGNSTVEMSAVRYTTEDKKNLLINENFLFSREDTSYTSFTYTEPIGTTDYDRKATLYALTDKFYIYTTWEKDTGYTSFSFLSADAK